MKRFALFIAIYCVSTSALADEPLPPPARVTACSSARTFCAVSDPGDGITVMLAQPSNRKMYSLDGWHQWMFVSNDGMSVVAGYSGMNLVPLDVTLKEPVLFFYLRGYLVRTVTLGDLYKSKYQLRRTVSHYSWAYIPGFNKANQLIVELETGRRVAFSSTGQPQLEIPDGT